MQPLPEPSEGIALIFGTSGQVQYDGLAGVLYGFLHQATTPELLPNPGSGQPADAQARLLNRDFLIDVADSQGSLAAEDTRVARGQGAGGVGGDGRGVLGDELLR